MIIIDEEDQSSLMLSMIASINAEESSSLSASNSTHSLILPFTLLIWCFRFACVVCNVPLGGYGFPD